MIAKDPALDIPPWNATVWKYMALDSFLALLLSKTLHFTNARLFTDRYESDLPDETVRLLVHNMRKAGNDESAIDDRVRYLQKQAAEVMSSSWVNCWSVNPYESYALWKIYLRNSNAGVAIKTNIKRLIDSIDGAARPGCPHVYIGRTSYDNAVPLDMVTDWKRVFYKTRYYEYEHELRLAIPGVWDSPGLIKQEPIPGVGVPVDITSLIEAIYPSPFAGPWFDETIRILLDRLSPELSKRVSTSRVRDQ